MTADRSGEFPYRFTCQRSGNCCSIPGGFVRVSEDERLAIAEYLNLDERAFASRYLQADGSRLKEGLGNRCVFLRDGPKASCSIYPVRPRKCRDWPFWPEALEQPELLAMIERLCPGIERVAGDATDSDAIDSDAPGPGDRDLS